MTASARKTTGGTVELRFPFNEELRDQLKDAIPRRFLRWDREDKVWRVLGAYAPTAINLLLDHFPRAEVPDDVPRRITRPKPPPQPLATPATLPALPTKREDVPAEPLLAVFPCATCGARLEQPIRVSVATSERVAMTEMPPAPEFLAVCRGCRGLLIVGFAPAVAAGAA